MRGRRLPRFRNQLASGSASAFAAMRQRPQAKQRGIWVEPGCACVGSVQTCGMTLDTLAILMCCKFHCLQAAQAARAAKALVRRAPFSRLRCTCFPQALNPNSKPKNHQHSYGDPFSSRPSAAEPVSRSPDPEPEEPSWGSYYTGWGV